MNAAFRCCTNQKLLFQLSFTHCHDISDVPHNCWKLDGKKNTFFYYMIGIHKVTHNYLKLFGQHSLAGKANFQK